MSERGRQDVGILVVDDDESIRELLAAHLADQGYRVGTECSGERALVAIAREGGWDLLITDLRMPGIDGLEVLRRAREKRPDLEVVVLTGYATIQDGIEAMREGAYDFLLKPVHLDQIDALVDRCARWICHKRSHRELQEVNRRLHDLARAKERFLAVTDHELRTPVTVIDGMLQHVLRQFSATIPQQALERLGTVRDVSKRLVQLVRDIHDLLESRTGTFPVHPEEAFAEQIAAGVRLDFEMVRFARQLQLNLRNNTPADLRLHVDPHRVQQAVGELIQNAVKATEDGGAVDVRLFVQEEAEGARFCVAVADTGVGIPEGEQQRIFEIFYGIGDERHHHSSKFDFMGAGPGVGLSLAQEIAVRHRGGIELESSPGRGSVFTFWVPLDPSAGEG